MQSQDSDLNELDINPVNKNTHKHTRTQIDI